MAIQHSSAKISQAHILNRVVKDQFAKSEQTSLITIGFFVNPTTTCCISFLFLTQPVEVDRLNVVSGGRSISARISESMLGDEFLPKRFLFPKSPRNPSHLVAPRPVQPAVKRQPH
jgi:hypothetical protein